MEMNYTKRWTYNFIQQVIRNIISLAIYMSFDINFSQWFKVSTHWWLSRSVMPATWLITAIKSSYLELIRWRPEATTAVVSLIHRCDQYNYFDKPILIISWDLLVYYRICNADLAMAQMRAMVRAWQKLFGRRQNNWLNLTGFLT